MKPGMYERVKSFLFYDRYTSRYIYIFKLYKYNIYINVCICVIMVCVYS